MSHTQQQQHHHHKRHRPAPHTTATFRGYTLDEMRYQKVLTQLRIQMAKRRLVEDAKAITEPKARAVASGIFAFENVFRYFDIALLGLSVMRRVRRVFSYFMPRRR